LIMCGKHENQTANFSLNGSLVFPLGYKHVVYTTQP